MAKNIFRNQPVTQAGVQPDSGPNNNNPDIQAINDLMGAMKLTISSLGNTFDALGAQAVKMAELAPAISAKRQVENAQTKVNSVFKCQNERIDAIKEDIKKETKNQFENVLTQMVHEMIGDIIKDEVQAKVRNQFDRKIPKALVEEVEEYKRQITEVKTSLHNSEARRYNALIQTSFDEPLRPLVRPVDSYDASVSPQAASGVTPLPSNPQLCLLTPSPRFPRDLRSLFNLGPEETRLLVQEYGLINTETRETVDVAAQTSLHAFMKFIGVDFELIPTSPSQGASTQMWSPIITRSTFSFAD